MSNTRDVVAVAVGVIEAFHRMGRKSLRARAGVGPHGDGAAETEAARLGISAERLRKARAFAHEQTGYTRDELDALCRAIRDGFGTFDDRGTAVGVSHIIRLLSLPKAGGVRARVQRAMLAGGWSVAELDAEIRRRYGRRRQGGRRPRAGRHLVGDLEAFCASWARWYAVLAPEDAPAGTPRPIDGLPADVCRNVDGVGRAIGKLHAAIRASAATVPGG